MYRYYVLSLAALTCLAASAQSFAVAVYNCVENYVSAAFALFKPEPLRFAGEGYTDFTANGVALDRALQNDMRHEAGVSRRSADRNI